MITTFFSKPRNNIKIIRRFSDDKLQHIYLTKLIRILNGDIPPSPCFVSSEELIEKKPVCDCYEICKYNPGDSDGISNVTINGSNLTINFYD